MSAIMYTSYAVTCLLLLNCAINICIELADALCHYVLFVTCIVQCEVFINKLIIG